MLCLQRPHHFRFTRKTSPIVILLDVVYGFDRQIAHDASFAEHVRTIGTTVHITALATPSTVQFAAIFTFGEFAAVVESKAFCAHSHPQHGMHSNDFLIRGRCADVSVARCAVHSTIGNHIYVRVCSNIIFFFVFRCAIIEIQFESCELEVKTNNFISVIIIQYGAIDPLVPAEFRNNKQWNSIDNNNNGTINR